jgi:23S rRNA (cytidine1920-2'-O)/16S rRNA (cytidine1409-2'-O)-methyltransferase
MLITETLIEAAGRTRVAGAERLRLPVVMSKQRLDTLMAERGLFGSRSRAAASVMAGEVYLEPARPSRRRAQKPGEMVEPDIEVSVNAQRSFVSRGGIKLANALQESGLEVQRRWALDVGASTGGFTDCLLQRGVTGVVAVDVGYGILDYGLRIDQRVSVMERTNARTLSPEMLPSPPAGHEPLVSDGQMPVQHAAGRVLPDLATIDVSFISLQKVLGAVLECLGERYDVMALVKPQFEVGRERIGKGGVVRDAGDRRAALMSVGEAALGLGAAVLGYYSSGLPGPKGNRETFIWLTEPGRAGRSSTGGVEDAAELESMARRVEP